MKENANIINKWSHNPNPTLGFLESWVLGITTPRHRTFICRTCQIMIRRGNRIRTSCVSVKYSPTTLLRSMLLTSFSIQYYKVFPTSFRLFWKMENEITNWHSISERSFILGRSLSVAIGVLLLKQSDNAVRNCEVSFPFRLTTLNNFNNRYIQNSKLLNC